ncbi:MAG: hypothetical protein ACI9Y1_001892 [Lentisphaeria bacterium]|jgi:hypothetical protein
MPVSRQQKALSIMIKRKLYLVHRWLGVAMSLFFLMWFVSGVVMMYMPFPSLSSQERLSSLPNLSENTVLTGPYALMKKVGAENIDQLRLTTFLARPVYFLKTTENEFYGVFADNGEVIPKVTSSIALRIAQVFNQNKQVNENENANTSSDQPLVLIEKIVDIDQWTVSGGLDPHRPFYKVNVDDDEGTHLYVSIKSGEVVRDTSRRERFWNWLGANLHWIYPVQLRKHPSVWHWVVVILSFFGVVSVLTGSVIGLMRLRLKKRYRGKDVTPYKGSGKYHHILGLVCCTFLFSYMFSGLLSMNPFGVFSSDVQCEINEGLYSGTLALDNPSLSLSNIQKILKHHKDLKEIDFYQVADKVFPLGAFTAGQTLLNPINNDRLFTHIESTVKEAINHCTPNATVEQVIKLEKYDSYYYSHHGAEKSLPVYRFKVSDSEKTYIYINAVTGKWVMANHTKRRVQRWLFNGLHSLDFLFLIERRPLWDVSVILLCVLGTLMSLTSVVIGSRRLYTRVRKNQRSHLNRTYDAALKKMSVSYIKRKSITLIKRDSNLP